nr:uncharacterized protein LOC117689027 [Crassostrea gigas]
MPRGKPKGNKDKGATCSGAGGGPSSLDSRKRKRRAESQLDFQQPTLSAIQVTQVPPTAVDEHQQVATSTGIENPTTSASTWQAMGKIQTDSTRGKGAGRANSTRFSADDLQFQILQYGVWGLPLLNMPF